MANTSKQISDAELAAKLRQEYTENPPEGYTASEIARMSDDDILDMDYFLHEDLF